MQLPTHVTPPPSLPACLLASFPSSLPLSLRQVAILGDGRTPGDALRPFASCRGLRVVVCGGDGSASWVLNSIDQMNPGELVETPSVVIVPLGKQLRERALRWNLTGVPWPYLPSCSPVASRRSGRVQTPVTYSPLFAPHSLVHLSLAYVNPHVHALHPLACT